MQGAFKKMQIVEESDSDEENEAKPKVENEIKPVAAEKSEPKAAGGFKKMNSLQAI